MRHILILATLSLSSLAALRGAEAPAFRPGGLWLDTNGKPINAHGGGVMWMHIDSEDYKAARAGVAVADAPAGPFRYLESVRPDGLDSRDQTLFQDDAGKYWFIASGCTGWAPNAARSAVADSIWGPWTELGNPCRGPEAEVTFRGQSTFVLPVAGREGAFIFMADRWNKDDLPASRHLWLPIRFEEGRPIIEWRETWDLSAFLP